MKLPASLAVLLGSLAMATAGETPAPHVYKGEIDGVACAACSKKVKTFLQKLPGVTSVKVTPAGDTGNGKIEIVSNTAGITKEDAIKALGTAAEDYTILKLEESKK